MKLIHNADMLKGRRVLFCDDSIVRGTQLRDNTRQLHESGATQVHMRIACPPLVFGCPFLNFSTSKTELELITRRIIKKFEGDIDKNVDKYCDSSTPEYARMVDEIASELNLDSLKFNSIETLVRSIGLPREDLCLHCFDGSSAFTLEEENK
jgi:amidophosphoribosyltransferase